MNDYTWPSVYFSYFFFAISLGLALFFFVRSWKDGYWGKDGEGVKYRVFEDGEDSPRRRGERGDSRRGINNSPQRRRDAEKIESRGAWKF
jgi:hypothetical protein